MTFSILLFLAGFYILVKGAKSLVRGAVSIARFLKMPLWVIGAVIVGVGTSLPEFSIMIASALGGNEIGLGTVIGSNTFNLLGILGVAALAAPLVLQGRFIRQNLVVNAAAVLVTLAVVYFPLLGESSFAGVTRQEGVLLLLLFVGWVRFNMVQHDRAREDAGQEKVALIISSLLVVAGLVGVLIGGKFVVDGAEALARIVGVSDTLIALLIVGPGTSLPELSITVAAAIRKEAEFAVGNIIGSNVFDFLGIIGAAALVSPVVFPSSLMFDMLVTLFAVLVVMFAASRGKTPRLGRKEGLAFLALYALYLVFLGLRG